MASMTSHFGVSAIVVDAPRVTGKGLPAERGLKHFEPGTKVYVSSTRGYDFAHYERALVAGPHRDDGRLSIVWADVRRLECFALVSISHEVANELRNHRPIARFTEWAKEDAMEFVEWRNACEATNWDELIWVSTLKKK